MRAHFGLPSVENDEVEGKPPITVKFEIPYFTVSGIQVRAHVEVTLDCIGSESELAKSGLSRDHRPFVDEYVSDVWVGWILVVFSRYDT